MTAFIKIFFITNGIFAPLHVVTVWPASRQHLARRIPEHLGGGLFTVMTGTMLLKSITGFPSGFHELHTAMITAVGGWLIFLQFCFANQLAVTELHLLYHSVLPRQRDDPEVDSFAGLIRFCQIWGNMSVLLMFSGLLSEAYTDRLYASVFETSLPDVLVCNVLFLGLFHHMQAIQSTKEEKLLHHGTWVAFVPATFFSGTNLMVPVICASLFIWSYHPYWRAIEEITLEAEAEADLPTIVPPAIPQPPVIAAHPAMPADPAEPAIPATALPEHLP